MSRRAAPWVALIVGVLEALPVRAQTQAPAVGADAPPAAPVAPSRLEPTVPAPTAPLPAASGPVAPASAPPAPAPAAAAPATRVAAARAQGAPVPRSVRVVRPACPLYDARELDGLLGTELGVLGIDEVMLNDDEPPAATFAQHLALLRISCADAPDMVTIQLADFASGKALEREVSVAGVEPKARPRLIAMTAAGLTESSWIELAVDPSAGRIVLPAAVRDALRLRIRDALFPAQPIERSAPASPAQRELVPAAMPARSNLQLTAVVRSFPARSTALAGIGVGASRRFGTSLRAWADVDLQLGDYELSDGTRRIGSMRLYWLAAGLGAGWVSATVPSVAIGPFFRGGFAAASSDASEGSSAVGDANGFASVVGLRGELDAPLSSLVSAFLVIEGGYAPNGVVFVTPQQRSAGMAESAMSLRMGIALAL